MFIYLDESGDLGFDFTKEGTSKKFTIALLVCEQSTIPKIKKAVKRTLKNKINSKRKKSLVSELKGTATSLSVKTYFLNKMPDTGWELYAITLNKERTMPHLQTKDGKKKLYNFITNELLKSLKPKTMNTPSVNLIVDRCKDGKDRKDFNAYIKANLETTFPIETSIYISHEASHNNPGLQAVDMFCYGIQQKENFGKGDWHNQFKTHIKRHIDYLPKTKKGGARAA